MRDLNARVTRTRNFSGDAAEFILLRARAALAERGEFRIALSGGNTPRPVFQELARRSSDLPWKRVFITFSDERCVPPESERSNYRMARESLFLAAAVPEQSVARMRGEIDPHLAADEYQDELDARAAQTGEMIYRHDLILLGLGDDGHTASLFPGTKALEEPSRRVMANFVPQLQEWRLTFTYPLLEQARAICFLVDEKKDRSLIERVLAGDRHYPAARVTVQQGEISWLMAEPA